MKCREAKHWLYTSRAEDLPPLPVQQHLEVCAACRQTRRQLLLMDAEVRQAPSFPPTSNARRQLEKRLDKATRSAPPSSRRVLPRPRFWVGLASAAAMVALGWFFGRYTAVNDPVRLWTAAPLPQKVDSVAKQRSDEMALMLRVVHHDVRLSETTRLEEKLDRLFMLADDLKDEALQLLRQGKLDQLPQVAELYQQVLRYGVGRRALELPPDVKKRLVPMLVHRLQATDTELAALAHESVPLMTDLLRPMQEATRETAEMVRSGRKPADTPLPPLREPSPLLAALVLNGLRLSGETDPLNRADLCTDLANRVLPSVLLLSGGQEASDLGECLATLLYRGVVNNLDLAKGKGKERRQVAEMERVRKRLLKVIAVLDKNLAHASPATQASLQNAMKAVGYSRKDRNDRGAARTEIEPPAPEAPAVRPPEKEDKSVDELDQDTALEARRRHFRPWPGSLLMMPT